MTRLPPVVVALAPVVIWAVHFGVLYGFTGFACARRMEAALPWVIGGASVVALLVLFVLAGPAARRALRQPRFEDALAAGLGGLAGLAIIWEASAWLGARGCG